MKNYQLPIDGSIVIIDDKIEEALPLIRLLSQKGIAATHYSGTDDNELPHEPTQKVRLVFADIQLFGLADPHSYSQNIIRILNKIIPNKNGPYILIVWSKTDDIYADTLEKEILVSEKPPAKVLRLKKSLYIKTKNDESAPDELLEYIDSSLKSSIKSQDIERVKKVINKYYSDNIVKTVMIENAIEKISEELFDKIKTMDVLNFFTAWENCIYENSGKVVESFSSLYGIDDYWEDNLRHVLYKMAYAEMGKQIKDEDDAEIIRNTVNVLNRVLSGEIKDNDLNSCRMLETIDLKKLEDSYIITKKIDNKKCGVKYDINDKLEFYIEDSKKGRSVKKDDINNLCVGLSDDKEKKIAKNIAKCYSSALADLNTKLCVDMDCSHSGSPGIVYKIFVTRKEKKELITNYIDSLEGYKLDKIQFIELNVVPFCDHAQKKWINGKERLLSGVMIPEEYIKGSNKIKDGGAFYKDLPILKIEDISYRCIFDFRLLKSKDFQKNKESWYKIKNEVLSDILSKLSNHANRIGVSFIE